MFGIEKFNQSTGMWEPTELSFWKKERNAWSMVADLQKLYFGMRFRVTKIDA
jgi:hypothetical protein